MDTVCIDKESSSELDESIRSMFKWYQCAKVCITYLADTVVLGEMHTDKWFTRGWTLQELVAPARIKFYARDWTPLGSSGDSSDKKNDTVLGQIHKATSITRDELSAPLLKVIAISRRMQWAHAMGVSAARHAGGRHRVRAHGHIRREHRNRVR